MPLPPILGGIAMFGVKKSATLFLKWSSKILLKYSKRWIPYYTIKYSTIHMVRTTVEKQGGVKGVYRAGLRRARDMYPEGKSDWRYIRARSALSAAIRTPGWVEGYTTELDKFLTDIIIKEGKRGGQTRDIGGSGGDGAEEMMSTVEAYLRLHRGVRLWDGGGAGKK
ncbi:hypothetical protein TrRE_jg6078 [Triparma retinervis]|uniref:Uncharacterized protein n=1 Tax=Triparma retinervis TaxID=2557542 RepID=A0A9W7AAZ7_9STRA|nr:hypothetical protein TrRE_jg6078 [Triparma retinervis]